MGPLKFTQVILHYRSFSSEESVFKVLYLRVKELYAKWEGHHIQNWAMVRNQLAMDDKLQARILKYEKF